MNTWKVILDLNGKTIEFLINARSYSDAYINAELTYANGRIVSLKIHNEKSV